MYMEWDYDSLAKSLLSLIKYNNGFFKSTKQKNFLMKSMRSIWLHEEDGLQIGAANYSVDITEATAIFTLTGYVRWAEYGHKSVRPIGFAFVFDDLGIVKQYKLHWNVKETISIINKNKTELIWSRDETIEKPTFKDSIENTESTYVGTVGSFIELEVRIKSIKNVGSGRFGDIYKTDMTDMNGNKLIYWGVMTGTRVGDAGYNVKIRAKVKNHQEFNNMKQTVISYTKIKD